MADVIFLFFLLPSLSAAVNVTLPPSSPPLVQPPLQPHSSPPPTQPITTPLKPSPPSIQPYLQQPPPVNHSSPPLSPPREVPQERMKNILEALIGSGDFGNWGKLLTTADPSLLPFTSTLFVPNNDVVLSSLPSSGSSSGVGDDVIDPFLFLYHIVPHRLTFADLCLFTAPSTRLPTLLPTKSILITNASKSNFSVDGARVTDPDLYTTDSVAVHGIGGLLDYRVYGGDGSSVSSLPWLNQSQARAPMKGVGVPKLVESSKGRVLRSGFGFEAFIIITVSLGLMMMMML